MANDDPNKPKTDLLAQAMTGLGLTKDSPQPPLLNHPMWPMPSKPPSQGKSASKSGKAKGKSGRSRSGSKKHRSHMGELMGGNWD